MLVILPIHVDVLVRVIHIVILIYKTHAFYSPQYGNVEGLQLH